MLSNLHYFKGSLIFLVIAMVAGYYLGGLQGAWIVLILGILETSLSFDNAIVNAKILKNLEPIWRERFILWGMPIAVFGMRLLFPLLIVSIAASMNIVDVLLMAWNEPDEYSKKLLEHEVEISAFGGSFLSMVALKFFIDSEKESHWLAFLEKPLIKLGKIEAVQMSIVMSVLLVISHYLSTAEQQQFIIAGVIGLITYVMADGVGALLGEAEGEGAKAVAKTGLAGFVYLEILDASFSLDGVIGAFALSNNLFIIALGLGVGAFFVRSFTLMVVEKESLESLKYIEHGAYWAITSLAVLMFLGLFVHLSEAITGLIGAVFIGSALFSSLQYKKKHPVAE